MLLVLFFLLLRFTSASPDRGISRHQLDNWASKFGGPLFEFARSVTKYNEILARFQNSRDSSVESIKLDNLLGEISNELNTYFDDKIAAITKTVYWAEQRANEFYVDDRTPDPLNYINAKRLRQYYKYGLSKDEPWKYPIHLDTTLERHFSQSTAVNLSVSTVHVPTSIYDLDNKVLAGIDWTSDMDTNFIANYVEHPTLNWQYFCSVSGFLRLYPGIPWPYGNGNEPHEDNKDSSSPEDDAPDLYDCRMRPWYISAANSYKSIVVLVDVSGSMTGARSEISRHVVSTILDTLTENDNVAVINFSDSPTPVTECFGEDLVQASAENIRTLKNGLGSRKAEQIAKFPEALNKAFDILHNHTSLCNKAIFLVTDGAPYNFNEIFSARQNPMHHIRVFTYLIGKEATDYRNVQRMACTNRGYFVHVQTLGQAQEEVLKYMPVMSRPVVMNGSHFVSWTPTYAHLIDLRMESDWAWAKIMAQRQRARAINYTYYSIPNPYVLHRQHHHGGHHTREDSMTQHHVPISKKSKYEYMISASMPVFDVRNTSGGKERLANFLGVVGTDIPLRELKRIVEPFKLGVNGYAFLITNNGRVVMHPDWRPTLQSEDHDEILKPNYNSVDITELELMDTNGTWRNNDSALLEMRAEMLTGEHSYRPELRVRIPLDNFHRVSLRSHRYEYVGIKNTPYTLVLSVPNNLNRFHGKIEIVRTSHDERTDLTGLLDPHDDQTSPSSSSSSSSSGGPRKWSLNPNWMYCEYLRSEYIPLFTSKEDELIHFLRRIRASRSSWAWRNTGEGIKTRHQSAAAHEMDQEIYRCDRDLVQAFVFDANATEIFASTKPLKFNKYESEIITMHGALLAFIMTRSGLTRWIELGNSATNNLVKGPPTIFATDSIQYQRAVDRYFIDPNSFIFSIPTTSSRVVTATRALFVRKNGRTAPVAVVGIQFDHAKWASRFFDITETCIEGRSCSHTCASEEYDCFVLDDNGFILITENEEDTGKFFGQVNGMVMEMLVNSDVYRKVRVVDYQGVCYDPIEKSNIGSILQTPLTHLRVLYHWITTRLFLLLLDFFQSDSYVHSFMDSSDEHSEKYINKTKLRPCDIEYDLYTYGPSYNTYNFSYHGLLTKCAHNCDGYFNVHYIPRTNLILVVTDGKCRCGHSHNSSSIAGQPVSDYNNYYYNHKQQEYCPPPQPFKNKRPDVCIDSNPEERAMREDCGGVAQIFWSPMLVSLLLFLLNIQYQLSLFSST